MDFSIGRRESPSKKAADIQNTIAELKILRRYYQRESKTRNMASELEVVDETIALFEALATRLKITAGIMR